MALVDVLNASRAYPSVGLLSDDPNERPYLPDPNRFARRMYGDAAKPVLGLDAAFAGAPTRDAAFAGPPGASAPPPLNDPEARQPVMYAGNVPLIAGGPSVSGEPAPERDMAAAPAQPVSLGPQQPAAPVALAAPEAPPASPGILARISEALAANPTTLLALGAGFAGAPSLGTGMSRAFANALPAVAADRANQIRQSAIAQSYKALVAKGVPPEEALAASLNPDIMKSVAQKYFEAKPPTWGIIGYDRFGQPQYGWTDPYKGTAVPGNTPRVSTIEEALKLPKGSQFVDPNGVLRVR